MATRERPWLEQYDAGLPAEIEAEQPDALALFEHAARERPDAVAVRYFDTPLTWAQVDAQSSAFAAALAARDVRPGDRVASFQQNVPQTVIAMVGTWKAGAIFASANPMLRPKELAHLLGDAGAVVLVTLESLWRDVAREAVEGTDVRTVVTSSELDFLDGDVPAVLAAASRDRDEATEDFVALLEAHAGQSLPRPELAGDDVALLTYTSGTTGPAKGAMNTHGAVAFNARTTRDFLRLGGDDVIYGVAPLFHITGLIAHMAVSFSSGAELLLCCRFDPRTALELIERHRATFIVGAITVFLALMNDEQFERFDLSSLRCLYSGGAPVSPAIAEECEQRFGTYVHNIYGLTETTSPSHAVPFEARAPVDEANGALSVGVPVFNTDCWIADDDGDEVAPGEVGEIVISGPQVVPGYWRQPEESAKAIRHGALHTGDIGFMDDGGWFYVVDRKKDQINASGYKVWPREVEDGLSEHPAVNEAAVVGVPDTYRGETVKAFVTLRRGQAATPDELIAFCKERMAAYKYPRGIDVVDELPKTASGKILRRELRDRG